MADSDGPPAKRARTEGTQQEEPPVPVPAALTLTEFTAVHRFLHDPQQPEAATLPRFGRVTAAQSRWKKRKVVLPGLGEISIVDDRPIKTTVYAGRARAGGCLSWWNPMAAGTPYSFRGAYSSTLESLTPTGAVTVSQLGRWPPIKGSPRAPVEDVAGALALRDPACMAVPAAGDPCNLAKPAAKGAAKPVTAVEVAKRACRCAACGTKGSKGIEAGQLRMVYKGGMYDRFIHPRCATIEQVTSLANVRACRGFAELAAEHQAAVASLDIFTAAAPAPPVSTQ